MSDDDVQRAEDLRTINAMRQYGGSFVQALAEAAARADTINLAKIKAVWPMYWEMYRHWPDAAEPSPPLTPGIS